MQQLQTAYAHYFNRRHGGRTQREIAAMFGVATGKAVGIQQEKVRRSIQDDRKLAKLIRAIESEIAQRSRNNS